MMSIRLHTLYSLNVQTLFMHYDQQRSPSANYMYMEQTMVNTGGGDNIQVHDVSRWYLLAMKVEGHMIWILIRGRNM